MRLIVLGSLLALLSGPALAQDSYPPVNTANLASKAELSSAITAATPSDCPAPMPDALVASAGSMPRCMPRQDAVRATQVQRKRTLTASDGTWGVTWDAAFPSEPQSGFAGVLGVTAPHQCQFLTLTATGATGICFQYFPTTLGGVVTSLPGTVISPYKNPSAGIVVMVTGRL